MEMILTGIENKNEYYTNHYFTSIFQDNAEDTIKKWKQKEKQEEIQLPWKKLRDVRTQYYNIRDRYLRSKNEEASKPMIQELATLYLKALGYESINSVSEEVADGLNVPIFHEVTKANGAPLLWAFLSVVVERDDDILQGYIFEKSDDEDENGASVDVVNDDILAKLFFAGEEAPRFILLFGINQIALIDRNKWNEKRYLQFMMEDIYSRHEESTFMAMTVLLHKESLCPADGTIVLDSLDENSHKHSAGVSDALKYALRESIEILGNEVIYDMKTRQKINLEENPVDASELTLECLRYMYRFLFMLFIEARPELGYAPMKSQTYVQGYSLEGLRDVCDQVKEDSEVLSEGYYIDDTLKKLFHMTYFGYPENLEEYKKAIEIEKTSMHDAFTIEALKAHIFDPEYTKLITKARLRNCAMLQIVDLMSISRPRNSKERKGRISYSALGINQMGAVYEALLSYRGFIAKEDLYEVKRAGDKFNELDVGYFVKENELENYDEKTERVRYESGEKKGQLRMYEKGTFIYRLAGREREKSASYYTPEVLTKCLVKYAVFHEPYVAVRLPFRVYEGDKNLFEAIHQPFSPYVHQQRAFERLTGEDGRSTLIATGTGSGKTECFLYPILEYCYKHRGEKGIKALIIYPMNALASDQAKRIAELVDGSEELKSAGIRVMTTRRKMDAISVYMPIDRASILVKSQEIRQ